MISEITQLSLPKYMKYKNKRYLNYILLSSFREDFLLDCSPLLFTRQILLLQPLNYLDCTTPSLSLSLSPSRLQNPTNFPKPMVHIAKIRRGNRLLLVIRPCATTVQQPSPPSPSLILCLFISGEDLEGVTGGCAGEEVGAQQGVGKKTDCRYPRAALNSDNGMT